jgi:hypothetical protein
MLSSEESNDAKLRQFPLAHFAAMHWFHHYENSRDGKPNIEKLARKLFRDTEDSFRVWISLYDVDCPWQKEVQFAHSVNDLVSPIYYTSLLGFNLIIHDILSPGLDDAESALDVVNNQGGYYSSALQAASSKDHENVVQDITRQRHRCQCTRGTFR